MAPTPDLEQPPPAALSAVPDDGVAAATIGTILFAVATLATLVAHSRLEAAGHGWWLWTAAAGTIVGLIFRTFAARRARVYREHAATQVGPASGEPDPPATR